MAQVHRNPNTSPRPFALSDEAAPALAGSPRSRAEAPLPLPAKASEALAIIEAAGGEAWCVGGCVRDALLGRPVHDADIAASLPWPATQAAFRAAAWNTVETGVAHGTLTVISEGEPFEITTYR